MPNINQANQPLDPVGAAWLAQEFDVFPMGRFPVLSQIGNRRKSEVVDGYRLETYVEAMRPEPTIVGHLQFHLRYEVVHLEFLQRLFLQEGGDQLQIWLFKSPTGGYARRAAFLYEWLTGNPLHVPENLGGNYVDAVAPEGGMVLASPDRIVKNSKWRVNDNLPGTRFFCPLIVDTDVLAEASDLDVAGMLGELRDEFGEELLMRAATWMTLRESKASFLIEGEADQSTRIQRFADVMARRTGLGEQPFDDAAMAELQREILGDLTTITRLGVRQSPVFVGETVRFQEKLHYVAPPVEDLQSMLDGLKVFLDRTQGQSAVMRCSVAAFAFVYIHPMADGNGRVHRFLINDILRRDGVVPDPIILPISAVITADPGERRAYDQVLDSVSKPLMSEVVDLVRFSGGHTLYPDGVTSNFEFGGDAVARPMWRYPNMSPHVLYLSKVIHRTIHEQMREEAKYLRGHHRARLAVKEVVEMPDHQVDRLLRSIEQNKGVLSNVLAREMPVLAKDGVWQLILEAVENAHITEGPIDANVVEQYRPLQSKR